MRFRVISLLSFVSNFSIIVLNFFKINTLDRVFHAFANKSFQEQSYPVTVTGHASHQVFV